MFAVKPHKEQPNNFDIFRDIFADTVLVDFGYTDDFDVITGAADKPDDKAIISIDYASTFDSDYNNLNNNLTNNVITLAKNKDDGSYVLLHGLDVFFKSSTTLL